MQRRIWCQAFFISPTGSCCAAALSCPPRRADASRRRFCPLYHVILPTEAGNYYLTADVTLSRTWTVSANIKLCLNGKNVTGAADKDVIIVSGSGGDLTITDCQETVGKITGGSHGIICNSNSSGGAGKLTLWNGSITGNNGYGGVYNDGSFTMYGGSGDPALWLALLVISGGAVAAAAPAGRRKKYDR